MSKIIEIALAELGVKESPAGSNNVKYNTWFYGREVKDKDKPGAFYPWCGTFVSWVCDKAGFKLGAIDFLRGYASCPYAIKHLDAWGRLVSVPQAGDVSFFDWEGDGKWDHTAFFVKDNGNGLFQTIEGNTAFGNDSNGGEVMLRERKYKNAIFVRPFSYEKATA